MQVDLCGKVFGRWKVITFKGKYKRCPKWECQCDCGTIKIVSGINLKNGSTQSCGCIRREFSQAKKISLDGLKFNFLTVVREFGRDTSGNVKWECVCDCGKLTNVSATKLKDGSTKSCGCYSKKCFLDGGARYIRSDKGREASRNRLLGKRGPDTLHWKGGKEEVNIKQRYSPEARVWRKEVYERDNFICRSCLTKGKRLNAHHIKPWAFHEELRFDVNNGISLCVDCHKSEHKIKGNPKKGKS